MIDIFTVVLPHALMAIAVWRLLSRDDLDNDPLLKDSAAARRPRKAKPPLPGAGTPRA